MKKFIFYPHLWQGYKKILLIMKLSLAMNLIFSVGILANSYSQDQIFNLNMTDVTVKDVIKTIESSSNYRFFYNDDLTDISKKVNIDFKEMAITEVLDELFLNSGIVYKVFDNNLIVIAPEKSMQTTRVTGIVTDASSGETLPGVNVLIEGTTTGGVTDGAGKYSIDLPAGSNILVFSFVGYNSERVEVNGRARIDITLIPDIQTIDEVVVIGYGLTKKSDLTGSVTSVSSSDYESQPVLSLTAALQGRAPGVSITNNSGAPGGFVKIRVRGANSINGGNDPLYVIDGIQLGTMGLTQLNVNDIESIEILKDASSTAIYGSRGANGVILITTKKGRSEKSKIDFTSNIGISQRSYKYNLLSPLKYAEQVNLVTPGSYSPDEISALQAGGGTDWQDELFRTGKSNDYQLSVSGTTNKTSYFFSGRYLDQTGIVINTNFKQYTFRTNVETEVGKRITIGANAFISRGEGFNNEFLGQLRSPVQQVILWGPAEPMFEDDGSWHMSDAHGSNAKNPIADQRNAFRKNVTNSAILGTKLSWKIFDFLTLDIIAGMDGSIREEDNVTTRFSQFGGVGANRIYRSAMNLQNSNILTFHKLLGDVHELTVTGVYELSKTQYDGTSAAGGGMPFTELLYYSLQANPDKSVNSYYGMSALRSYVGRVNYILKGKYMLTATYRADGSSKFPNNKWGYFPSAAIGYRLSEESFIQDLNLFSNLKLRASWGITGNQGVNPFATIPQMIQDVYTYGTSVSQSAYEINRTNGDPDLKWEQTTQTDIGVDMGFFKNRLSLSADYFMKSTKDLLLQISVPMYQGGGTYWTNLGEVENKGVELTLSGVPIDRKDLSWNFDLNFSSYRNKVVSLGGAEYIDGTVQNLIGTGLITTPPLRLIVGEPLGTFYGQEFLGIYQEHEAAEAARYGFMPGDSKYQDITNEIVKAHDGSDSTLYAIDSRDRKIIGNALPKFVWSFDNSVRYKNFELNVFLQGVHGNKVLNCDYSMAAIRIGDSKTITVADIDHWTPGNKNNQWPSLTSSTNKELMGSSKWLQDGSFVRIKNVSLAYYLPKEILKGTSLKLMLSAQNLHTFTKYIGYDPEANITGNSDIDNGVVMGAYPSARTYTITAQLTF